MVVLVVQSCEYTGNHWLEKKKGGKEGEREGGRRERERESF